MRGSRGHYADDVQLWEIESAENGQARLPTIAGDSYRVLGMLAAPEKYDGVPIQPAEEVGSTTEEDVLAFKKKLECPRGCGKYFAANFGLMSHLRTCRFGDGDFEESPERDGQHDVEALLEVRGHQIRDTGALNGLVWMQMVTICILTLARGMEL